MKKIKISVGSPTMMSNIAN